MSTESNNFSGLTGQNETSNPGSSHPEGRVVPDAGIPATTAGTTTTGYNTAPATGYDTAPGYGSATGQSRVSGSGTESERAKEIAARATGGALGHDGNHKTDFGLDEGVRDGRVNDTTGGVGAVPVMPTEDRSTSMASGYGDRSGSTMLGERSGSSTLGDRSGSTDPTNARKSNAGIEQADDIQPQTGEYKEERAREGVSEGADADESQATEKPRHDDGKTAAKRENKSSIPSAGGVKLGEKHWGESGYVPDVPKTQEEEQGVSSKEGQPDQSTKDNTAKNAGQQGEGKEGMMDKLKHKMGK